MACRFFFECVNKFPKTKIELFWEAKFERAYVQELETDIPGFQIPEHGGWDRFVPMWSDVHSMRSGGVLSFEKTVGNMDMTQSGDAAQHANYSMNILNTLATVDV